MSSNPPGDRPRRTLRPLSLRARLLVGQVAVLAVVCALIGVGAEIALDRVLVGQLDAQLVSMGHRATRVPPGELPGGQSSGTQTGSQPVPGQGPGDQLRPPGEQTPGDPGPPSPGKHDPGPDFLGAPGNGPRALGARIIGGQVTDAGVLGGGGERRALSAPDRAQLADLQEDGHPHTVSLGPLGDYRVVAIHAPDGSVTVTGLPLDAVQTTVTLLALIFTGVAVVLLAVAAFVGREIVRRTLRPLGRVAGTAREVAALPLDRGDVASAVRVPEQDTDPRTEVGQVGAALNRMLEHVWRALGARAASEERMRQFLADASHELRTPLSAIRGYAELTRRSQDTVPADIGYALGRVEAEAARMTTLVEDLLLLARLDAGRPLERNSVDLTQVVADAVSDAHIAGRDHHWRLALPEEPLAVTGDEDKLRQVLTNLLGNARVHTPPETTVTTALASDGDGHVLMTVTDDGPGIPADLAPTVFERFARGDTSRSRASGSTGLGLAIVAAVTAAHGGTSTVASEPGSTVFTVRLPVAGPTDAQVP